MTKGIDVSKHNDPGRIDWGQVKAAGYSAVMVRLGWAGNAGELHPDPELDATIRGAAAVGLDVGLYVYTYATSVAAARRAAQETVETARRYPGVITYPIAYDVEYQGDATLTGLGRAKLTETVAAFCDEVEALGYYACWYTSVGFANAYLDKPALAGYDLWVADYRGDRGRLEAQLGRPYGMWQYTVIGVQGKQGRDYWTHGQVPGVPTNCDVNEVYKDYPAIVKRAGLNGFQPDEGPAARPDMVPREAVDRLVRAIVDAVAEYQNTNV